MGPKGSLKIPLILMMWFQAGRLYFPSSLHLWDGTLHNPLHPCFEHFEPKNGGLVQMIFLFNFVIIRVQSLIFRGVRLQSFQSVEKKSGTHRCSGAGALHVGWWKWRQSDEKSGRECHANGEAGNIDSLKTCEDICWRICGCHGYHARAGRPHDMSSVRHFGEGGCWRSCLGVRKCVC